MNYGRLLTAMVTPFDENLEIDLKETEKLVEHLIENGTQSIVVAGTTGESPTITDDEKLLLYKNVLKFSNNRVKVIAGTGSNCTKSTIELTKRAEEIGVDGIMLVAPYYNKPSQEAIYKHFKAVANETKLPVMIYNIPSRTGINITAETIIRLSCIDNIQSVKEASGNINQICEIIKNTDDDFYLYSGDDSFTLPVLAVGGYGCVSVASHIVGNKIKEMIDCYINGEVKAAALLNMKLSTIFRGIFITSNPSPIKCMLRQNGLNVGSVRAPLIDVTKDESEYLSKIYEDIK